MRGVTRLEYTPVEAIWAQPLVKVRGLYGLHHILVRKQTQGCIGSRFQALPQSQVCVCLHRAVFSAVNLLEVLRDRLLHLVLLANELVILDH